MGSNPRQFMIGIEWGILVLCQFNYGLPSTGLTLKSSRKYVNEIISICNIAVITQKSLAAGYLALQGFVYVPRVFRKVVWYGNFVVGGR